MTATDGAPDPIAAAEARWDRLVDRLDGVRRRLRDHLDAVVASLDACLAGLDALHDHLAELPLTLPSPPLAVPGGTAHSGPGADGAVHRKAPVLVGGAPGTDPPAGLGGPGPGGPG